MVFYINCNLIVIDINVIDTCLIRDVWTRKFRRPQEAVNKRLRQHVSVNVWGMGHMVIAPVCVWRLSDTLSKLLPENK